MFCSICTNISCKYNYSDVVETTLKFKVVVKGMDKGGEVRGRGDLGVP